MINENGLEGYVLEVDLEYPDELHELHNDYSLGPEINHDMLPKYCNNVANKCDKKLVVLIN